MCRMIGFVAREEIKIAPFLAALALQAETGKESLHGDGWGMTILVKGQWVVVKQGGAVWKAPLDELGTLRATLGIFHARKASPGTPVNLVKVHPFYVPDPRGANDCGSLTPLPAPTLVFCHNGTVANPSAIPVAAAEDAIDSERILALIVEKTKRGAPLPQAVEDAAKEIYASKAEPTSLNCLLSDGSVLIAYKGSVLPRNRDYHTLFIHRVPGMHVVTTEPIAQFGDAASIEGIAVLSASAL